MTRSIPLQRFTDRTVIVTGGGSGFGEAMEADRDHRDPHYPAEQF